jgi:hypothetical protein
LTHAPAVFSAGTVNADFSLRVDGRLERGASLIAISDHVTPNHDEAQRLTGVAVETAAGSGS